MNKLNIAEEKEKIKQSQVNKLWLDCEMEDVELLEDRVAIRAVICPWGYVFVHTHVAPNGGQLDLQQTEKILKRKTEDSLRFLLAKRKIEGHSE